MKLCLDTWFFYKLKEDEKNSKKIWESIVSGEHLAVVPSVVITEIVRIMLQKGKNIEIDILLAHLVTIPNINIVENTFEIAVLSAKYGHSLGIPTIDSLIIATAVHMDCDAIVSGDSHIEKAKEQKIIRVIKNMDDIG